MSIKRHPTRLILDEKYKRRVTGNIGLSGEGLYRVFFECGHSTKLRRVPEYHFCFKCEAQDRKNMEDANS